MVTIKNNTITITQGDTLEVPLCIHDELFDDYIPGQDELIRIAIKSYPKADEPIIVKQISPNLMTVRLEASETKQLKARKMPYFYDIELRTPDDHLVATVITGDIYVTEEVM